MPAPAQPNPAAKAANTASSPLPASGPAIRALARQQGLPVGVRGRLAADIVTAYAIAHGLEVVEVDGAQLATSR
jgi:DNA polymerase-3 subunit epsilon